MAGGYKDDDDTGEGGAGGVVLFIHMDGGGRPQEVWSLRRYRLSVSRAAHVS
jgi:hypothetical protein